MIPARFDYFAPRSVDEAVSLLRRFEGEAKVLAGGHSLLPLMKLRLAQPRVLVDINEIPGLAYVREEGAALRIGATTRTSDLLEVPLIHRSYPILPDAVRELADPLVRNRGTVGGNLCHGDPGNDLPACFLALGAEVALVGPGGRRSLPLSAFYRETFVTALEPGELLVEVRVPRARVREGSAYAKLSRRRGEFAVVGAAAHLHLDREGTIVEARVGLTGVGPTPLLASAAADALIGQVPDEPTIRKAAACAAEFSEPASDARGPTEYKRAMVAVVTRQVIEASAARARGGAV